MNLLALFIDLANRNPADAEIEAMINTQPENIREAIFANDSTQLKQVISTKKIFANEVQVTLY